MKKTILLCLAALSLSGPVVAADDHKGHNHAAGKHDDHAHKPKYGGVVTEVKEIQYELVTTPAALVIYVEDHGKKVDTKGGSAKVTLLSGANKTEVSLAPAGENKLEGKIPAKPAPGTKAMAVVTLAGKSPATVKFALK